MAQQHRPPLPDPRAAHPQRGPPPHRPLGILLPRAGNVGIRIVPPRPRPQAPVQQRPVLPPAGPPRPFPPPVGMPAPQLVPVGGPPAPAPPPLPPQGPMPLVGGAPPAAVLQPPDEFHIVNPLAVMSTDAIKAENRNLRRIALAMGDSPQLALQWAARHRLVPNSWTCPICNRPALLAKRTHNPDGCRWECRPCRQCSSVRAGTWFDHAHLTIEQALIVTYCWVYNHRQFDAKKEAEVLDRGTLVHWYGRCREVCDEWLQQNAQTTVLGGLDQNGQPTVVEVDESMFFKRKYNRGRQVQQRWVFGGIQRNTGMVFMVEVDRRDAPTLEREIVAHIRPGTRIITDGWQGYNGISRIPGQNYIHDVIVHDVHFVDPNDPTIHTQRVENLWMRVKKHFRERHGLYTEKFTLAVHEWIVRNYFRVQYANRPGMDFFEQYLVVLGETFPG